MSTTMKKATLEVPGESQESFAALAAAVHPAWHQAVIRLAKTMEDLSEKMSLLLNEPGSVRENAGKVINLLIAYLDLIDGDDEGDDSELEDDDPAEDGADDEPSLGSNGHGSGGPINYTFAAVSAAGELVLDCEGDEHDGCEPEHEDYDGKADEEPSLGWTDEEAARGQYAGARGRMFDLEDGPGAVPPQNRTEIDRAPLTVENGHRRFLRGLLPAQRDAMKERMSYDSGVSLVGGREWGLP